MSTSARTAAGDLALPRVVVTNPAAVCLQTVIDAFNLWQTEWYLDQTAGFPWQRILGAKNPNITQIQALIRQQLLAIPGVVAVTATAAFDRARRALTYSFSANLNLGVTITGGSGQAFQVTGAP